MPDKHHKYGPSGLASYEKCPRFEKREQREGEAHPVAIEGTMLHAKVELRDVTNLNSEQTTMVENALAFMDKHTQGSDNVEQETVLDICKKEDDTYVSFGTTDLVAHFYDKKHAVSIDWKFGWTPVAHPETNLQVWCYVVGLFEKYDYIETVDAHVYMARYGKSETFSFSRSADLNRMKLRILTVVERVEKEAEHTPSTEACLYCAAKGTCPALASHALSLVEEKPFDIVKMVSEITDPVQMEKVLKAVDLLDPWCKEVKEKAKHMILNGDNVLGYGIRERKGSPTMGNPSDVYDAVKDKVTIEEFNSTCDVKLTKLKKLVREKAPKGTKGLSEELLVSTLKQKSLLTDPEPSLVLYKRKKI